MQKYLYQSLRLFAFLVSAPLLAPDCATINFCCPEKGKTTTFAQIYTCLNVDSANALNPAETAIFFDIDDTLFRTELLKPLCTSCLALSPENQKKFLEVANDAKNFKNPDQKINGFSLTVQSLWDKAANNQDYWPACEQTASLLSKELCRRGAKVFCCTAGGVGGGKEGEIVSKPANQRALCVNRLVSLSKYSPLDQPFSADIISPDGLVETMTYYNGIVHTNGSFCKGLHILAFLKKAGLDKKIKNIVLIDDNSDVLSLTQEALADSGKNFIGLLYKAPSLSRQELAQLQNKIAMHQEISIGLAGKTPFGRWLLKHYFKNHSINSALVRWILLNATANAKSTFQ